MSFFKKIIFFCIKANLCFKIIDERSIDESNIAIFEKIAEDYQKNNEFEKSIKLYEKLNKFDNSGLFGNLILEKIALIKTDM